MTDLFKDDKDDKSPTLETDSLKELVGEDKPFKTVEALAKGKAEADSFIEQLKKENSEMRESVEAADKKVAESVTMDAIMERIRKATDPAEGNQSQTLGTEDIQKLVKGEVSALDAGKRALANQEIVTATVLKHFGNDVDKAKAHTQMRAKFLGITADSIGETAATSPKSALSLLGIELSARKDSGPAHLLGRSNQEASTSLGVEKRNFVYYNKMRKELGAKFFEPTIQQQKMRDLEEQGEDFFKD